MARMLLALCALAAAVVSAQMTPTEVVNAPDGPVQGVLNSASGVKVFKGIPYAAPPVGDLRFADTQPVTPWSSTLDATKFSPGCMATCPNTSFPIPGFMCTPTVSEDCLYLNIYVPNSTSTFVNANAHAAGGPGANGYPVLVFIHGGNYKYGSGGVPIYDGQELARTQGVIVVTINYRLGVFGSLYTGASVQGNFQTKDQIQALKWVQKNIGAFGGDKTQVTISGQSAGAYSVATLLIVQPARGLFSKAIIMSSPFSLLAARPEGAIQLGTKVLEGLNCPQTGGLEDLYCLRNASAEAIQEQTNTVKYSINAHDVLNIMMEFLPIVDGTFLPYQPIEAYKLGQFAKVPIFFGTVANESVEFIEDISHKPVPVLEYDVLLDFIFGSQAKAISQYYGPPPKSMDSDARPFLEVIATDFIFYCVNRHVGGFFAQATDTYMWMFDYLSFANEWVFGKTMPYCVNNVCHAEDLTYVFFPFSWVGPWPGEPLPPPEADQNLATVMQGAWGNFIYTGNPNPLGEGLPGSVIAPGTHFPQFNATTNALVNYSVPTSPLVGYRNDVCDFWDTLGYLKRR